MPRPRLKSRVLHRAGDLVTQRDCREPMTTEAVSHTAFGMSLSCCWFDGDDCLHFAEFPSNQLEPLTASAKMPKISIDTELRLRSGGPVMTVLGFSKAQETDFALCEWTGPHGRCRQRLFSLRGLVLSMFDPSCVFDFPLASIDGSRNP